MVRERGRDVREVGAPTLILVSLSSFDAPLPCHTSIAPGRCSTKQSPLLREGASSATCIRVGKSV